MHSALQLQQRQLSNASSCCSHRCSPNTPLQHRRHYSRSQHTSLRVRSTPGAAGPAEEQPGSMQGVNMEPVIVAAEPLPASSVPPPPLETTAPVPANRGAALLQVLRKMDPSLLVFLAGGALMSGGLWQWAQGSPLRRSQPYEFMVLFDVASKVHTNTPVRMKGVQIGQVTGVSVSPEVVRVRTEVSDSSNIIPRDSRIDINQLGLAADAYIDITPPDACDVRGRVGPHHAACEKEGVIICAGGEVVGHQGGSMDYMMKSFMANMDKDRKPDLSDW